MDDAERENKFGHLLKPIRDLAENWDIDIAAELEEYLDELEKIVVNFEDGNLNLNFAEAALLIQGSTLVYSKKVEFLYNLVYKVLGMVCGVEEGKGTNEGSGAAKKKKKKKSTVEMGFEEKENFLLLDDVIPIGQNIALNANKSSSSSSSSFKFGETLEDTQGLRERIPFSLVAQRATTTETSGAFKMMSCDVDSSGAFMLEKNAFKKKSHGIQSSSLSNDSELDQLYEKSNSSNFNEDDDSDDGGGFFLGGGFDDEDDFGDNDKDIQQDELQCPQSSEKVVAFQNQEGSKSPLLGLMDHFDENEATSEEMDANLPDPWKFLDPHENLEGNHDIPIKKAKTWKVPKSLQKDNAKTSGKSKSIAPENVQLQNDFNLLVSLALVPKFANRLPARNDMVLYPEFRSYAADRRRKIRVAKANYAAENGQNLATVQLEQSNQIHQEEREEEFHMAQMTKLEQQDGNEGGEVPIDNNNEFYYGNGSDGGNNREGDEQVQNGFNDDDGDDDFYGGGLFLGGGDTDDEDDFGNHPNKLDLDSAAFESEIPDTYVDMVKKHLQTYLESANQWASESKLHSRVRKWEEKIQPRLNQQELRPTFDIHVYGGRILEGLVQDSESDTIPFDSLSARLGSLALKADKGKGKTFNDDNDDDDDESDSDESNDGGNNGQKSHFRPLDQSEVCRMFLASLQLANNGNVELVHESNTAPLRVKLLDTVLANEKLAEYEAPETTYTNSNHTTKNKRKRQKTVASTPQDTENLVM